MVKLIALTEQAAPHSSSSVPTCFGVHISEYADLARQSCSMRGIHVAHVPWRKSCHSLALNVLLFQLCLCHIGACARSHASGTPPSPCSMSDIWKRLLRHFWLAGPMSRLLATCNRYQTQTIEDTTCLSGILILQSMFPTPFKSMTD
eukprot:5970044-Amphidinium_carterae.1